MIKAWNNFWFSPIDLFNVALMRMILGGAWFVMYLIRFQDFTFFYGNKGILPLDALKLILPPTYQSIFPFYFTNENISFFAYAIFLALLLGLCLGAFSRSLTWLIFILQLGFMQRNYTVVYGADLFSVCWMFHLSFVNHNKYFSIWNLFRADVAKKISLPQIDSDMLSTVGVRMIQIQLCVSYAYTGIEKLKGAQWWEGVAVWEMLGMKDLMTVDMTYLQNFPIVIALATMITVIFEIYFGPAMLNSKLKPYWLAMGVFFHVFTAVFLSLIFFCMTMLCPYLLFVDSKSLRFFIHQRLELFLSLFRRFGLQS